jgi:signal transduction histidine kinase
MIKKCKYTLSAFVVSLAILVIGRGAHLLAEGACSLYLLPQNPHDRTMFLVVSSILVVMGFCADRNARLFIAHEEEKRRIFLSTVAASQHVLNNFLNNMLYFQQQARESRALDDKTLKLYDTVIHDAAEQLKKLGEIQEISERKIRETVYPR